MPNYPNVPTVNPALSPEQVQELKDRVLSARDNLNLQIAIAVAEGLQVTARPVICSNVAAARRGVENYHLVEVVCEC